MPTTTSTNGNTTDRGAELLKKYREQIALYSSSTGAARAVAGRRISETAVELRLLGVEYEPWTRPSDYVKRYELSETQLADRIRGLRAMVKQTDVEPAVIAAGERMLAKAEEQAKARGVKVS